MKFNFSKITKQLKGDYKKVKTSITKKYDETMKKIRKTRSKKKGTSKHSAHTKRLKKDQKARKKAEELAKLPKSRFKRIMFYLNPKRAFKFWFSKQGLILGLKIFGIGMAVFIFTAISAFAYFRRDIEADPANLKASLLEQTTRFYDNTGKTLIYSVHGDKNRTWVEFDDIAKVARDATVAIEDKDFYTHGGFSITGVVRAAYDNVFGDETYTSGGSTITQQFVKNAFLSGEKTYTRKIKELILSLEMERLYSKEEILQYYLNQIPYGSTEYGIEAASQSFFNKPASELTLDEAAMLAALPQAPSALSPYNDDTSDLVLRQHTVINLMRDQGYITAEQAEEAKEIDTVAKVTPLEEKNQFKNLVAPHYVVEVQRILEDMFGKDLVASGGLKVTTTLHHEKQKIANKAVRENMKTVESPAPWLSNVGDNAALVAVEVDTGNVVAMVGSRNYNYPGYGAYNAALANRQPGSSFKPYVYAQLFYNERWGADSYIYDTPSSFNNYRPQNWDGGFKGRLTVRNALGGSRNIPAVKAMHIAGVDSTINLARNMGVKSLGQNGVYLGLSAALGAGEVKLVEHTLAYSTFARDGNYMPENYILKVENSAGEVLFEWEKPEPENVLDPQNAYLITDILTDRSASGWVFGANNPNMRVPGLTHTVKTGTTNEAVDGWMMGYSNYYSVGVWVGNHDNEPMFYTSTSRQTGPIWTQFMQDIHKNLPDVPIHESNPGAKRVSLDKSTGYKATDKSQSRISALVPSWYKAEDPPDSANYTIDKVSGKVATSCTPDLAKEEVKGSPNWPEILPGDPFFANWSKGAASSGFPYGANSVDIPEETDDVHDCDDDLPVVSLNVNDLGGGVFEMVASVSEGTHDLDELQFKVDGQIVENRSVNSSGNYSYEHTFTSEGSYTLSVELIDDVLYNSTDNQDVEYSGESISLFSPDTGDDADNIVFAWNSVDNADEYRICWDRTTGPTPEQCADTSSTSHNSPSLSAGKKYEAYVRAYDDGDLLATSPVLTFTPS